MSTKNASICLFGHRLKVNVWFMKYLCNTDYSQELPSRFRKEMVEAMLRRSQRSDSRIHLAEVERVLTNIGASDKISQDELLEIFHGDGVDVKQMIMYL